MLKFLLFIMLLLSPAAASPALTVMQRAHLASYEIRQSVIFASAGCTATAIGPHALLTATHCELPTDTLEISSINDGEPVTISGRIRDGQDHTIYLLKNVSFTDYVDVDLNDPLTQGEDVFMFGNPGDWHDQFRRGYITGYLKDHSLGALFGGGMPERVLFDFPDWHGDSGAGIFNQDGKLVAVVSTHEVQAVDGDPTDSIRLTASFRLGFSQADLTEARK